MKPILQVGALVATGAAMNISLGFTPDWVKIVDDSGNELQWFAGMAAASAYKRIAAGTGSKITSNGISQFAGSASAAAGFTLGVDGLLNVSTTPLKYVAGRNV